jgi:hypothetical protein
MRKSLLLSIVFIFGVLIAGSISKPDFVSRYMLAWRHLETVHGQSRSENVNASQAAIWQFDKLEAVGEYPTTVLGHPHLIDSPYGKAVEFNGVDDALFVGANPLAGASTFTWEVIFRPDADGAAAQRFFHLQAVDPQSKQDTRDWLLFEIRIENGKWCLDSYATSNGQRKTLRNCQRMYDLGKWYRVTAVYDGKTFSNYVGDELQDTGELQYSPIGTGRASIGTRISKAYYFKGAVLMARMAPSALSPNQFLKMPPLATKK